MAGSTDFVVIKRIHATKSVRTRNRERIIMPIYEFYCKDCHTIFNFFSKTINTTKLPKCPKCNVRTLNRQISVFAFTGKAKEADDMGDIPFNEGKMEQAMQVLAKEADRIDEDDPRQAAHLMRKISDMTGLELSSGMHEVMKRMEKGEDPDQTEAEMGGILEEEDPFIFPGKKGKDMKVKQIGPFRDETLYDL